MRSATTLRRPVGRGSWRVLLLAVALVMVAGLPPAQAFGLAPCRPAAVEWIIGGAASVERACASTLATPPGPPTAAAARAPDAAQRVRPEQQRLRDDERLRILAQELAFELAYQAGSAQAGRTADAVARSHANSTALRAEIGRIRPAIATGALVQREARH